MSKKRTSTESNNDEQTNENSEAVFQQDENSKRANLTALSDTTLQDLPMELIECILIKVVAMEVMGLKLVKSVWKEKADLVMSTLGSVCSQWNSIVGTEYFRSELHGILDGIAQETIRLEILHQSPLKVRPCSVITMKDEIFLLYAVDSKNYAINVYDRNNHLSKVKDVIPLATSYAPVIAACNTASCVYALTRQKRASYSTLKFVRDAGNNFVGSSFTSDLCFAVPQMAVTHEGLLVLSSQDTSRTQNEVSLYENDGSLRTKTMIRANHLSRGISQLIPKSNGNLVLLSVSDSAQTVLTEINAAGVVLRQYQSAIGPLAYACNGNRFGHLLLATGLSMAELLDSEFNQLLSIIPQHGKKAVDFCFDPSYNAVRDEIVAVVTSKSENGNLMFLRVVED